MCKQVVLEELLECSLMRPVWGENCGQKTKGVAWLHAASEISYPILASCSKTIAKRAVAWAAYLRSKEAGLFVVTCYIYLLWSLKSCWLPAGGRTFPGELLSPHFPTNQHRWWRCHKKAAAGGLVCFLSISLTLSVSLSCVHFERPCSPVDKMTECHKSTQLMVCS